MEQRGDTWRARATGGGRLDEEGSAPGYGGGPAKAEAQRWLHADASTFLGRVSEALAPFLGSTRVRQRLASVSEEGGSGALDKLLHVSSYIGDAGFDLLVPRAAEQVVQRVEVKRVSDLGSAVFYLSENERRQALALAPNWHLWLVSGDGRSRDVSWLRQHLEEGDLEVDSLLRKGLRPNDWLFHIHP